MLSILRFILLPVSILFTLLCFINLSGASLPYPDATQALLEQQREQIDYWSRLLTIGYYATGLSTVFLVVVSMIKKSRRLEKTH